MHVPSVLTIVAVVRVDCMLLTITRAILRTNSLTSRPSAIDFFVFFFRDVRVCARIGGSSDRGDIVKVAR